MALLPVVALTSILLWAFAAAQNVSASTDKFVSASVPGELTLATHPGTWYIYADGGTTVRRIDVSDPSGGAVAVKSSGAGSYMSGGQTYRAVGQFSVSPGPGGGGEYRVVLTGSQPYGGGAFAVGNFNVTSFMRLQHWGMGALLVVNVGSAIAIAVAPLMGQRREDDAGVQDSPERIGPR